MNAPVAPPAAAAVFGAQLPAAERFAALLTGAGIERGLLGPREAGRIWERHLLNCAALTDLLEPGDRVVDLGSGAGLPGLVLALRRPDLTVELVEPLERRCRFLAEAIAELHLADRVHVIRGRADDRDVQVQVGTVGTVTARAVAPLDRLVRWALPLLQPGGRLLAMKGERADEEMGAARAAVRRAGGRLDGLQQCAVPGGDPVRVVVVTKLSQRGRA